MGIYLNPGNESFAKTIKAPIYVDKTMLIQEINRFIDIGNNYICMSRPRRFGKTITGRMLAAYYSRECDSKALFSKFKIANSNSFEEKLNKYNVIKIDINGEYQASVNKENTLTNLIGKIKVEMQNLYPSLSFDSNDSLADSILKIYSSTGVQFVIILDEYDALIRENVASHLYDEYISFLNGLFKNDTVSGAIALAYITGIFPVVRDKIQSKLNNFREYTILDARELSEYVGFTADEVKALCEEYNMDFVECQLWYDGYKQKMIDIYNPQSVVMAMENKEFESYWSITSTYQVISERLNENFDGVKDDVIRMLSGESVDVKVTTFMNTVKDFHSKNDIFTYLIHLGYLTYNRDDKTCRIPNREIWQEWESAISIKDEYKETNRIIEASRDLMRATFDGNADAVAEALDESHIHVTSNRSYNNEDALQSAIYLAYLYAINEYTIIREMTAGKGFADVVFIPVKPEKPAMIIELKRNDCADSALYQIKDKKYFDSLYHYHGRLLFVGINYDEKTKKHSAKIEWFEK